MLLSFRFANHRSFRDEQQLNLLPVYGDDDTESWDAVPVVGIFGANASGKSNVISAFEYMSRMVGQSDRESEPGQGPRRQPFRLDREVAAQPSSYAVDLLIGDVRHTYGFTIDDRRIIDEWLYAYPLRRKRVVFERAGQEFDWGEESARSSVRKLADIVAPTALFLSVTARFDPRGQAGANGDATSETLHDVFSGLWQRVHYDRVAEGDFFARWRSYSRWLSDPERRTAILGLVRHADLGLEDAFVSGQPESSDVFFRHRGTADDDVLFTILDESSGTLRLLELAAQALPVLEGGGLFLVDEIDASLHPLLSAALIHLFQSPDVNANRAQLVFTTHDATLLGSIDGDDVLDRDQVWFTSKRGDGASELFPLSEFKPRRQGENRQKRYLNGSYGAVPELSMRLFEQAVTCRSDQNAE